ncbi:MAG TPA: prephenate dehydrogenase [Phnomibacter sp.]|nr:prephenate dehydrogenase [Phnomibacter sp.]
MKAAVIGLGLIGGSVALLLKQKGLASQLIGVDNNEHHRQKALELGLVRETMNLEDAVKAADFVVVAVPVDNAIQVLLPVLDIVTNQVVMDMGSTKAQIIDAVSNHPRRGRFVAAHPMWGTEFSGPEAATVYAFAGKAAIICNREESDADALSLASGILQNLGMHLVYMNATDHDVHTAYISHISHITSFALANTVLEKEKEEGAIFELASAGFESTVRLAKSNPDMWVPIFRQNKENVLDVLNEHISQLRKFKACLEKENWGYLRELIQEANNINRILK